MGDTPVVNTEASLLGIPYTVREEIYVEILEWIGLELFFYFNVARIDWSPYPDANVFVVGFHRSPPKHRDRYDREGYLINWMKSDRLVRLTDSLRWPTFLGLLNSCTQVRLELGELFWRRTLLDIGAVYNKLFIRGLSTLFAKCLEQKLGHWSLFESIQKVSLDIRIETPTNRNRREKYRSIITDINSQLKSLLESLSSLRHLTLCILNPETSLRPLIHYGVFEVIFSALEQAKNLESVHIKGIHPQIRKILRRWRGGLPANINESTPGVYPRRCFSLEKIYVDFDDLRNEQWYCWFHQHAIKYVDEIGSDKEREE